MRTTIIRGKMQTVSIIPFLNESRVTKRPHHPNLSHQMFLETLNRKKILFLSRRIYVFGHLAIIVQRTKNATQRFEKTR